MSGIMTNMLFAGYMLLISASIISIMLDGELKGRKARFEFFIRNLILYIGIVFLLIAIIGNIWVM